MAHNFHTRQVIANKIINCSTLIKELSEHIQKNWYSIKRKRREHLKKSSCFDNLLFLYSVYYYLICIWPSISICTISAFSLYNYVFSCYYCSVVQCFANVLFLYTNNSIRNEKGNFLHSCMHIFNCNNLMFVICLKHFQHICTWSSKTTLYTLYKVCMYIYIYVGISRL